MILGQQAVHDFRPKEAMALCQSFTNTVKSAKSRPKKIEAELAMGLGAGHIP